MFIIAACIFIYSIYLGINSSKTYNLLRKYEFENRTEGGVVQFACYEDSKKHESRRAKAHAKAYISGAMIAASGLYLFMHIFCVVVDSLRKG